MLPVAVEIAPPDTPREHAVALLAACSRAVAEAECVPAADAPQSGTQAVAIVTWHGDERVVVEVGLRAQGKPVWRSRTLTFSSGDAFVERWRAVGYVVGTLARDERPADEPPTEPAATEKPPERAQPTVAPKPTVTDEPKPSPMPSKPSYAGPARAAIDIGGVVGPAWSGIRSGGVVRTRWPLQDPLRVQVSLRYLERARDGTGLSGQWLTAGAGVGGVFGAGQLELAGAIEVRGDYFRAHAEDSLGRTQSDGRVQPGVGFGLNGAWMPIPSLGVYLGGDLAVMFSHTNVIVRNEPQVVDAPLRLAADAGVRLKLW